MFKKFIAILIIAFCWNTQNLLAQDYIGIISNKLCECFNLPINDSTNNEDMKNKEIDNCLLLAMKPYQSQIQKDFNYNLNTRNYQDVNYQKMIRKILNTQNDICLPAIVNYYEKYTGESSKYTDMLEGTIIDIKLGNYVTFILNDLNGKQHTIVWITEVISKKSLTRNYKGLIGKPVVMHTISMNLLNVDKSKYEKTLVLTKISF